MKKTMVTLVMLVALTGCKKISPKKTTETVVNDPAGIYTLVTVNDSRLPATVSHGDAKIKVHSGAFTIDADGTCSSKIIFGSPSGDKFTRQVKATYTQEGSTLNMQWIGAGKTKGIIKSDTFTMNNEGMIFSYKKRTVSTETK